MNDEIMVKFGGDLTNFSTALRGMKGMVNEVKKEFSMASIGEAFKGGLAALGVGFGVEKISESARASMELAEHIRVVSEELGVSTSLFQYWNVAAEHSAASSEQAQKGLSHLVETIGKARSGTSEAVETFKKWNISLDDASGKGLNNEQVFEQVSKRILSIEDPAQRAAAAVELLGKKGELLIESFRKLDEIKGNKGSILTERELALLETGNEKLETLWTRLKTLTAKAWSVVLEPLVGADALWKQVNKPGEENTAVTQENITKAKDFAKAQEDIAKAMLDLKYANSDVQGRYRKALEEMGLAQAKFNEAHDGTIEKLQAERDLIEAQARVTSAKAAAEKDEADKKQKSDEKHKQNLEQQKQLTEEISKKQIELQQFQSSIASRNAQFGTLQEVANAGFSVFRHNQWEWQSSPLAAQAQRIMDLEARAHNERLFGNKFGAEADESLADQLREGLEKAGAIMPQDHLKVMSEKTILMQKDIADLTAKLKELKESQE